MRKVQTILLDVRPPLKHEDDEADAVFVRHDPETGESYSVYASVCHESWQQWGTNEEVLRDNIASIEQWRANYSSWRKGYGY